MDQTGSLPAASTGLPGAEARHLLGHGWKHLGEARGIGELPAPGFHHANFDKQSVQGGGKLVKVLQLENLVKVGGIYSPGVIHSFPRT